MTTAPTNKEIGQLVEYNAVLKQLLLNTKPDCQDDRFTVAANNIGLTGKRLIFEDRERLATWRKVL